MEFTPTRIPRTAHGYLPLCIGSLKFFRDKKCLLKLIEQKLCTQVLKNITIALIFDLNVEQLIFFCIKKIALFLLSRDLKHAHFIYPTKMMMD